MGRIKGTCERCGTPVDGGGRLCSYCKEDGRRERAMDMAKDLWWTRIQHGIDEVLRVAITDALGHEDWPGDVDPPTVHRYQEAVTAVVAQLIENGLEVTDRMDALEDEARRMDYHLEAKAVYGEDYGLDATDD